MLKNDNSHAENKFNKKEMHLCSANHQEGLKIWGADPNLYIGCTLPMHHLPRVSISLSTLHLKHQNNQGTGQQMNLCRGLLKNIRSARPHLSPDPLQHPHTTPNEKNIVLLAVLHQFAYEKTFNCLLYWTNLPRELQLIACCIALICLEEIYLIAQQ